MPYEPKSWLTTGAAGTADGDTQNDPDLSWGKFRSDTEISLTLGNLWTKLTLAQLAASITYRIICLTNANITDVLEECRVMSNLLDTLDGNISIRFGVAGFDDTTAFDSIADEDTPPSSVTFFDPFDATGVANTDWASARKIGPISTYTNSAELTADEGLRIFLAIELTCANVNASAFDGTNNKFGIEVVGADA